MIQKELAFRRERSGTVTVPGANSPSGILPRRLLGHCGASVATAIAAGIAEGDVPAQAGAGVSKSAASWS
jgi:hypothetical protein